MHGLSNVLRQKGNVETRAVLSLMPLAIERKGLSQYAAGLLEFLAKTPDGAWVIGWSMGGAVALEACLIRPALFKGLILLGATPRFTRAAGNAAGASEASVKSLMRGLANDSRAALSLWLKVGARFPTISSGESMEMALESLKTFSTHDLLNGLDYLLKADWRAGLANIQLPVLVLHARGDALIAAETAQQLAAAIPGARLKIYEQADHFFPMRLSREIGLDALEFINLNNSK